MGYIHRLLRLGEGKAKARAKSSTDSLILGPRCIYILVLVVVEMFQHKYIYHTLYVHPPSHTPQVILISDIH